MKSIYLSTIHAVPAFRANKGGSFINIASTAGVRPRPGLTWYNGSKGAVITTSKSLAAELGPDNIRVNCINPVFNPDTGLSAEFAGGPVDEARRAKFLRHHSAGALLDRARRGQRRALPGQRRSRLHLRGLHRGRRRAAASEAATRPCRQYRSDDA